METRICTKCHIEKNISEFSKHEGLKDGYDYQCKQCVKEAKQKLLKNRVYIQIETKICTCCQQEKSADEFGKNKYSIDGLNCYCKECKRQKDKEFHKNHKIERNKAINECHARDKEGTLKRYKRFCENNPEKVKNWRQVGDNRRRAQKFNLEYNFTVEDWKQAINYFNYCCAYCNKKLTHKEIELEHFIPVSKNGPFIKENILPVCTQCNDSKHAKNFLEWYPKQSFYSEERKEKISKYFNQFINVL